MKAKVRTDLLRSQKVCLQVYCLKRKLAEAVPMFKRRALATILVCCFSAVILNRPQGWAQSAPSSAPEQRKTSEPYTGDLSIFESPGRDQRLQINRVMDVLAITAGKTVAD